MGQGYILSCFSFFFRLVSTLRMQFLKTQPAYSISYKPTLAFEQMLLVLSAGLLFARYQFFEQYFLKITTGIRNFEISLATINPSLVMILQKISSLKVCFITHIIFSTFFMQFGPTFQPLFQLKCSEYYAFGQYMSPETINRCG